MTFSHLNNIHAGETCIVIGNGPSLANVPMDFLNKYRSFGTNKIYLLGEFVPDYYVVVNDLIVKNNLDAINNYGPTVKFSADCAGPLIKYAYILHTIKAAREFSFDPTVSLYSGWTVMFVCLQLAYFMGFETVLLVGVDHRYRKQKKFKILTSNGDIGDHFIKGYFRNGETWNPARLDKSEEAYLMARNAYESNGRRIINLTVNTALEVFEKGNINDY